jgi:hypothetical protein
MTVNHAPGPLTYAPTVGGYAIYRADNWPIAVVVQRDDHPVKGGGITEAEAKANAVLFATSPDLLALARQYASECGDCAGTRVCPDDEPCTASEDYTQPCPDCADLRAILERKP